VGRIDGEAFPGGTANDVSVEIGGGGFIPGFTEQLEGLAPGESRTIEVTFPADYQAAELAGKAATFDVTAKGLKTASAPALDDALATKIGFEDFAKLRDAIRGQVAGEYDEMSRLRIKRELLDALAATADFAAPPSMVEAEFGQIWQRVEADRKEGRLDDEDAAKSEEQLRADYRAIAERRVKLGLLLAEIGRANNIQVAQDELFRAMRGEAARFPGQEQQVFEFFQKNPRALESLRGPIYENKVVDYILELATVDEQEVSPEELARFAEEDGGVDEEAGAA
jgi:trigger factor